MASKKLTLRSDERGERVTVYVDPELARALRVYCAEERSSLSAAVSEALRRFLAKRRKV